MEGAGRTRRLIPIPAVTQIFHWRVVSRLAIATIVARLNADPAAYPPPVKGGWVKPTVNAVLANPKYTGTWSTAGPAPPTDAKLAPTGSPGCRVAGLPG